MSISNNNNNNDQSEIPLELSKALKESGTIQKFVIDPTDKYVKLRLNSKVNPPVSVDASTEIIIKKPGGWEIFVNRFVDNLKKQKLANEYFILIISDINTNGDLIRRIARATNNYSNATSSSQRQGQGQENNNESDVSDVSDTTTQSTNEEKIIVEKTSISRAIRRNSGIIAPTGTIIGISRLSKMMSKVQVYC